MYNLPVGVGNELDDQDMICENCDKKDDVDNGTYVNHRWYCDDCYKELFKKCPKCEVIISVDDELCEDCLAEKTYDESALGMFEKLGYKLSTEYEDDITYKEVSESKFNVYVSFDKTDKTYDVWSNITYSTQAITLELHNAIVQQMKELKWL